eukprot:gene7923-9749_t
MNKLTKFIYKSQFIKTTTTSRLVSSSTPTSSISIVRSFGNNNNNKKKEKIVILGCGWASFAFLQKLKTSEYDVTVISPRNHFLFTPLLASTSVGTLEFRSIAQPVRGSKDNFDYIQAKCTDINPTEKTIQCLSTLHQNTFQIPYDKLIIGVGARNNTFNIPGVQEHAHFLKELHDARAIRKKIIQCFEMASLPDASIEERHKLLSMVVVGGGPTGCEFTAELNDFFLEDLSRWFPHAPVNEVRITLLEASGKILSAFDEKLVQKALKNFRTSGIEVRTHSTVKEVQDGKVILKDGTEIPYGLLVWSTGIGHHPWIEKLPFEKDKQGRIIVDNHLKVKGQEDIYCFGDCSKVEDQVCPSTAQVAQQMGVYLSEQFNNRVKGKDNSKPFVYQYLGMLAYIGRKSSLFQTQFFDLSGFIAFLSWRSVYLTRLGSLRSKLQVPFDWFRSMVFGRDISNF